MICFTQNTLKTQKRKATLILTQNPQNSQNRIDEYDYL